MKKQLILMGAAVIFTFAACNDSSTSSDTTKDTTTTQAGDTTIQTTTTTTTTTKTVHPIANFEHRTFMNVKTHQPVKLRMDTVLHYYVDMTTNQQPDYYYYDPAAKDTFDYMGRILNNALINDNGNYRIEESRLMSDTGTMMNNDTKMNGNLKIKQKDDLYKEKTDSTKIKVKTK